MKKIILAAIIGGIFLCLGVGYFATRPEEVREDRYYKVAYVIDGDTFVADADGRDITVRMLGIDTPETVDPSKPPDCFGREASNATKALLKARSVHFGINKGRELKDRYDRYLLYVYRDDGLFVNEYLIREGFAREYTFGRPYSMQAEFRSMESKARKAHVGLWGKCQ